MATQILLDSTGRAVAVETVAPVAQASTNALAVLAGSEIDARIWRSLAYTLAVATNDVEWAVYGANASDYSDEQAVQAQANVAAAGSGSYAVAQAPYAYYRAKIISHTPGAAGSATLRGIAKG